MTDDVRDRMIEMLPRLRRFAFALTGCQDRGEDLVQETCVKALGRADQWQPGTRFDSWMFRIAKNQWIDTLRLGARYSGIPLEKLPVVDAASAHNSAAVRHEHHAVRAAVNALPPEQRAIVALVCIDGFSYREAAETLAVPIGTVMSRLARARKSLDLSLYGEEPASETHVS